MVSEFAFGCFVFLLFPLLPFLSLATQFICNDDDPCTNTTLSCHQFTCEVICESPSSCLDLNVFCASHTDRVSSECEIICEGDDSCHSLIIESYRPVNLECTGIASCVNAYVIANPLYVDVKSTRILCENEDTCDEIAIDCGKSSRQCNLDCEDAGTCREMAFDCRTNDTCSIECGDTQSCRVCLALFSLLPLFAHP